MSGPLAPAVIVPARACRKRAGLSGTDEPVMDEPGVVGRTGVRTDGPALANPKDQERSDDQLLSARRTDHERR